MSEAEVLPYSSPGKRPQRTLGPLPVIAACCGLCACLTLSAAFVASPQGGSPSDDLRYRLSHGLATLSLLFGYISLPAAVLAWLRRRRGRWELTALLSSAVYWLPFGIMVYVQD